MRTVKVPLGNRTYPILIGTGLLDRLGEHCSSRELGKRCGLITDSNVGPRYAARAIRSLRSAGIEPVLIKVRAGESSKNLKLVEACCERLALARLERGSFVVALGGGVVGDLAGFVAAAFLRGIAFVQVPTTLLAQVDSSVGGKVGVNLVAGKNLVGAFHQPRRVLCDLGTLKTLPPREFRAGLAEVIKYGIIRDPALFRQLEGKLDRILSRDLDLLAEIVARCCAIKAEVVGQDETEGGLRAILNFGHTIGHAIEAVFHYGKFLHGEAISIGQIAAARISARLLGLPQSEVARIEELFARTGLPTRLRSNAAQRAAIFRAMSSDKKVREGQVRFVLARRIGEVEFGCKVPRPLVREVIQALNH